MTHTSVLSSVYEVLNYEATVELSDADGRHAVYIRREHVRFLQDGVSGFEDYGWGSGIAFASHDVSPGTFVHREIVGSRLQSTVELPHRYHAGETMTFWIERVIQNGFTSPSECWLEAELYHPTRRLSLKVILPAARPVRSAHLVRPGIPGRRILPVMTLADGRQRIFHLDLEPAKGARYTVIWDW